MIHNTQVSLRDLQAAQLDRSCNAHHVPVTPAKTIDEYIRGAAQDVWPILRKIREIIRESAPAAEECISYRMPAFRRHGILIYFAAFKNHIGIFPPFEGDAALNEALLSYRGPKGNLRFPLDEPIPYDLIGRIAAQRARQDEEKARKHKNSKNA